MDLAFGRPPPVRTFLLKVIVYFDAIMQCSDSGVVGFLLILKSRCCEVNVVGLLA